MNDRYRTSNATVWCDRLLDPECTAPLHHASKPAARRVLRPLPRGPLLGRLAAHRLRLGVRACLWLALGLGLELGLGLGLGSVVGSGAGLALGIG